MSQYGGNYDPSTPVKDLPARYEQIIDHYRLYMNEPNTRYPEALLDFLELCMRFEDPEIRFRRLPGDPPPKPPPEPERRR